MIRENRIDKFEELTKLQTLPNLKIFICSCINQYFLKILLDNPIIYKN